MEFAASWSQVHIDEMTEQAATLPQSHVVTASFKISFEVLDMRCSSHAQLSVRAVLICLCVEKVLSLSRFPLG